VALLRDARGPDEAGSVAAPAPRLAQVDGLVEIARAAGIAVTVDTVDTDAADPAGPTVPDLPAAVELAAYRIVQEALTNVVRHSDAGNVAVSIRRESDRLVVEVTDDGTTSRRNDAAAGRPTGYGLVGMAERAAAVGGRVDHGPAGAGGFRVHAVLPAGGGEP
jgi:signal transduction histidine kinase